MKQWVFSAVDKQKAHEIAKECDIAPFLALLLASKGIHEPFEIDEFLSDEILLQDPFALIDMDKAVQRVSSAIESTQKIAIFGDYDCDGITSTALVYSVLKNLGADVSWRLPSREEGYGITEQAVVELKEQGVELIVTVDNGITAHSAIDKANELGIDVVVTDHHLPDDILPKATAIVDPKRKDCPSEFKEYAGVGVAFMFCCALSGSEPEDMLEEYADLVTLGTIADVMPLLQDNRAIVKAGLNVMKYNCRVGINALIEEAGLNLKNLTASSVAFGLSPRINASGRVLHPKVALELLLCEEKQTAKTLAKKLCEANTLRQQKEKEILQQAINIIDADEKILNAPVLIVCGEGWLSGVLGIVASRLCHLYSKPAIVFSLDEEIAHGSARGIEGVSIYDILAYNTEYTETFGGHTLAAGVSVKKENFDKFVSCVQYSAKALYGTLPFEKLNITCKLNPALLSIENAYDQMMLEPFGQSNTQPIYALCDVFIREIKELTGGKHLRLLVAREGQEKPLEVMYFNKTLKELGAKCGDKVDIAVTIDINEYMGTEKLSVIARDIRVASSQFNEKLHRIREYQNFKYFGEKLELEKIDRDDVVAIYKIIRAKQMILLDEAGLSHLFECDDFAKIKIILDVLKELGFITVSFSGKYTITVSKNAEHKDLSESVLYNMFSGEGI